MLVMVLDVTLQKTYERVTFLKVNTYMTRITHDSHLRVQINTGVLIIFNLLFLNFVERYQATLSP